jgi:hypothetical protein
VVLWVTGDRHAGVLGWEGLVRAPIGSAPARDTAEARLALDASYATQSSAAGCVSLACTPRPETDNQLSRNMLIRLTGSGPNQLTARHSGLHPSTTMTNPRYRGGAPTTGTAVSGIFIEALEPREARLYRVKASGAHWKRLRAKVPQQGPMVIELVPCP